MNSGSEPPREGGVVVALKSWWVVLVVMGLGCLAIAQPLLDLLGRNPEFFIARRFPPQDIVLLAVIVVIVPAVFAIPALLARLISPRLAAAVYLMTMAFLVAVAALVVMNTFDQGEMSPWMLVAGAAVVGIMVAGAYLRFEPIRTLVHILALAPVVVVVWFLVGSATKAIVFESEATLPDGLTPSDPVPVVLMILDEFPVASIMHADGSLDSDHYPNLSGLADEGVWYRNAIGVRQQTEEALPSILTGRGVDEGSIPTTADHPYNLLTLLDESYDIAAVENVTELCPDYVCANDSRPADPPSLRWSSVANDVGVVYRHLLYPDAWAESLPAIDGTWGGFGESNEDFDIIQRFLEFVEDDRRREVDRFIDTLDARTGEPVFRFGHFLYPHHPWDLNADTTTNGADRPPGRLSVGWGPDAFLVAQGWQRHLVQVAATDALVGDVLDRLRADGLFDDALIVVAADHGIAIAPNVEHQRVVTDETVGSVAAVPMIVKYPAGMSSGPPVGTIDDTRAETVDILPTIAEVVGITVPWRVDGVSLLSDRSARVSSVMLGSQGPIEIPADFEPALEVAMDKEALFAAGDPFALVPEGGAEFLGASVADIDGAVATPVNQASAIRDFQPGDDRVPTFLSGTIDPRETGGAQQLVAITVDGEVVAVSRTYLDGESVRWEALLATRYFEVAAPDISAYIVSG